MYPVRVLLITLATFVRVGSGEVFDPQAIDPYCTSNTSCATLYFYDENNVELHKLQGTFDAMTPKFPRIKGIKGVSKVQIAGEYGCYIIYNKPKHRGGKFCWAKNDKIPIGPGTDYEWTVVKSVEYDSVCKDPSCSPSKAGIPSWAIAVSVLVVLLIAVAIFLVYKRKRSSHDALSTNDGV